MSDGELTRYQRAVVSELLFIAGIVGLQYLNNIGVPRSTQRVVLLTIVICTLGLLFNPEIKSQYSKRVK
jgi:hypothetical protein